MKFFLTIDRKQSADSSFRDNSLKKSCFPCYSNETTIVGHYAMYACAYAYVYVHTYMYDVDEEEARESNDLFSFKKVKLQTATCSPLTIQLQAVCLLIIFIFFSSPWYARDDQTSLVKVAFIVS